jgi:tetratricopeptide (TPR) repeat protein
MRDKLSDKLTIFVRFIVQCKPLTLIAASLFLAACASNSDRPASSESDHDRANVGETRSAGEEPPNSSDMDSELLFHVLAAERLMAVGDFEDALGHYLTAAHLGEDIEMARQAVRVAMRVSDWERMAEAAALWGELAPGADAGREFLILARINAGAPERAAELLAETINRADDDRQAWREAVVLLGAADDTERAVAVLDALVETLGEDAEAALVLENRSFLMWQLGRGEEALRLALKAAESDGGREPLVWAAQLAAAEDDLEMALSLYRRARGDHPTDASLGMAEAEVLRQLERTDEAIMVLKELPPDSEVLYTLGTYLVRQERTDEAAAVWRDLAAIDAPEEPDQHAFLSGFLAELLEFDDEALAWYEQVQSGPNVNRALLRRGIIVGDNGDLLTARNLLRSVRLGDERDLSEQALLVEADLLREAERADEAVDLLTEALRERPSSVALLYSRAICAVAADDLELAEQDFRRILQLEDDNAMALNALGYTLTDRTDRHGEAYRLIRRAYELEPEEPAILDSMGWVYFRQGQPEQALPYLERALAGDENSEIAAHLIEVLWVLGRRDEARQLLEEYRSRFPDDPFLTETSSRLGID